MKTTKKTTKKPVGPQLVYVHPTYSKDEESFTAYRHLDVYLTENDAIQGDEVLVYQLVGKKKIVLSAE